MSHPNPLLSFVNYTQYILRYVSSSPVFIFVVVGCWVFAAFSFVKVLYLTSFMATTSAQGFAPMLRTFSNQTIKSEYDRERNLYDIGRDDGKRSRQEPSKAENWKLMPDIQSFSAQADEDGRGKQRLGVTWNNLQAKGYSSDHVFTENVLSQFNIPRLIQEGRHGAPLKTIIEDSSGCVKPGDASCSWKARRWMYNTFEVAIEQKKRLRRDQWRRALWFHGPCPGPKLLGPNCYEHRG